jgi:membrane fusion protein, multidrug efflux system
VYRWIPIVVWILSLTMLLVGSACQSPKAQSAGLPPSVPVSTAPVTEESIPLTIHAVGRVEPSAVVQVKSQIAGAITRVAFTEGANVRAGELLFEIDERPYRNALRQAEASVARDTALLRQAEANLERDRAQAASAKADAERNRQLNLEGLASRSQNEQSQAAAGALEASIAADQAAIESARASFESDQSAVDRAKLDLAYCEIHAPVSGRTGNLLIAKGNLVPVNGNPLVVINQLTPIWATFAVPEDSLASIRHNSAEHKLPVKAVPRDNPGRVVEGALVVIDNTVDAATGTIHLKAAFENQAGLLWPGQFVDVVLTLDTLRHAVVVPSEAVQAGQNGQMVYVVKPDQTVAARPVKVGANYSDKLIVDEGLKAGETVVVDGQLRLFPGARVQVVPAASIDSKPL